MTTRVVRRADTMFVKAHAASNCSAYVRILHKLNESWHGAAVNDCLDRRISFIR